ncbi:MAG: ATP synthase F1 subunit delta [Ruminiclostridium sp.]|nr:ATP synthase F1 subunit delta [Ruminiclostridium sp.]
MQTAYKTYAEALFSLVTEEKEEELTQVFSDLNGIAGIFKAEPDFIKLLKVPTIPVDEKLAVIKEVFEGKIHVYVLNFLYVLTENGRADSFSKILEYFTSLYNDKMNLVDVTVTSARELGSDTVEKIKAKMTKVTGKTVNLTLKTDTSVIGGVVISYGNTVIDGSVRSRLERLKADIAGTIA